MVPRKIASVSEYVGCLSVAVTRSDCIYIFIYIYKVLYWVVYGQNHSPQTVSWAVVPFMGRRKMPINHVCLKFNAPRRGFQKSTN